MSLAGASSSSSQQWVVLRSLRKPRQRAKRRLALTGVVGTECLRGGCLAEGSLRHSELHESGPVIAVKPEGGSVGLVGHGVIWALSGAGAVRQSVTGAPWISAGRAGSGEYPRAPLSIARTTMSGPSHSTQWVTRQEDMEHCTADRRGISSARIL